MDELCAMAPDLLRWGDDLISDTADYNDVLFEDEIIRVSESDDLRRERHLKISLLLILLPIRAIYVILRSFLFYYRLALSINHTRNRANLL